MGGWAHGCKVALMYAFFAVAPKAYPLTLIYWCGIVGRNG
jgi:hypothetical protein